MKTITISEEDARRLPGVPAGAKVEIEKSTRKHWESAHEVYYQGQLMGTMILDCPEGAGTR